MTDGSSQPTPEADAEARRLLSVDHLQSDIVARSVRSGGVTLAAQAMKVLVQGAAIIVLARLLAPADFGLFAMVAAFLTLLELFKDLLGHAFPFFDRFRGCDEVRQLMGAIHVSLARLNLRSVKDFLISLTRSYENDERLIWKCVSEAWIMNKEQLPK